jgi:hypothetical protein
VAIAFSSLTDNSSASDATTYATASVTLTANRLYLLFVSHRTTTGPVTAATATSTGATWVAIDSQGFNNDDGTGLNRITVLRTMVGSDQTGAITIAFGGQTQLGAAWAVIEVTGMDTSGTNGSGAIVTSNKNLSTGVLTLTLTFAALSASANRPIAGFGSINSNAANQSTDWTQLAERIGDTAYLCVAWNDSDADTTVVSTISSNSDHGGVGIEIKAAAAATKAPNGKMRLNFG